MLRTSPRWQLVGEAGDAFEAIQQAGMLRPDLILLDIELPALSGIEAARQILACHPGSRILFLSAHRSWDIVEAALLTGAQGYILKADAGSDLLPAMEAIVEGRRFLGAALAGRAAGRTEQKGDEYDTRCHEAAFYSDTTFLLDEFARFVEAALHAANAVIVLLTGSRRRELHQRLDARGLNIDLAIKEGRYLSLDVADVLGSIMVDGWPDEERFWKSGISLMMRAARASSGDAPRLAACGECAASLAQAGGVDAAIRLEHLWDELARTFNVDILCGYSMNVPRHDEECDVFRRICAEHSVVHSG
jgi:DNA-binding response OmpR family regulator